MVFWMFDQCCGIFCFSPADIFCFYGFIFGLILFGCIDFAF